MPNATSRRALHAAVLATITAIALGAGHANAQTFDPPPISPGFTKLVEAAADVVGRPLETDRRGEVENSTIVRTTTGLLYWQPGLKPTWTDGWKRFTLDTRDTPLEWDGTDLAPPKPTLSPSGFGFGVWDRIKGCETPNLGWNANTGNGFYGGLQFDFDSWLRAGGGKYARRADLATPAQQVEIAWNWLGMTSWGNSWPACSRKLGLR